MADEKMETADSDTAVHENRSFQAHQHSTDFWGICPLHLDDSIAHNLLNGRLVHVVSSQGAVVLARINRQA